MKQCNTIPRYTPVASFLIESMVAYENDGLVGMSGIFMDCIPLGFQVRLQSDVIYFSITYRTS